MSAPRFIALFVVLVACAPSGSFAQTALVRHAPVLNGSVSGSIQLLSGENVSLNTGALITGDLLVPGTPKVRINGKPSYSGTIDRTGSVLPVDYQVSISGKASLHNVVRRTNPIAFPVVAAPPPPRGTRSVAIAKAGQSAGASATLRNLTLSGNAGLISVPPGTYGDFVANDATGFTLGVPGSLTPTVYNFQHLKLGGRAQIQVVGAVEVTVNSALMGCGNWGSAAHPSWLKLNLHSGGLSLNGGCHLYAYVSAPDGLISINGDGQLIGGLSCDRFSICGDGFLRLIAAPSGPNHAPAAQDQEVRLNEDTVVGISLRATDPDGNPLSYSIVRQPEHGALSGQPPAVGYSPAANYFGSDSFTFIARDSAVSSPPARVSIVISPVNDAPIADPQSATGKSGAAIPIVLTGSDIEADALTFSIVAAPVHGTLALAGSHASYTSAVGFTGSDSFTYRASDGQAASNPALVSIEISAAPTPDGPIGRSTGMVYDASTREPVPGVSVASSDGNAIASTGLHGEFTVTAGNFGGFANKVSIYSFSAPGYIPAFRKEVSFAGTVGTLDPVYLKKLDGRITWIGADGGTATNAAGDVEVDIPMGATGQPVAVQLTNYDGGHELPGILPANSAFTYAVDLSPEGAVFSQPVTVRIANGLGFSPGTPIPVGVFDPSEVRWEPESMGTVSDDGRWVVFSVNHFSARDANLPVESRRVPGAPTADGDTPGSPVKRQGNHTLHAARVQRDPGVGIADGTYQTEVSLPGFQIQGRERSIRLVYESDKASGNRLFPLRATNSRYTSIPLGMEIRMAAGNSQGQATYRAAGIPPGNSYHVGQYLDLSDLPTGFYLGRSRISNIYPSTYAMTPVFGGSSVTDTGIPARVPGRASSESEEWFPLVNRVQGEFGAGWGLVGFDRLHFSPDNSQAMIAMGDGGIRTFRREDPLVSATPFPLSLNIHGLGSTADGDLLLAHQAGISLRKREGGVDFVLRLRGLNSVDLSSYALNSNGGVMDVAQSESGALYFIAFVGQEIVSSSLAQADLNPGIESANESLGHQGANPDSGSPLRSRHSASAAAVGRNPDAGLFRYVPSTGEIALLSSDLRRPTALTLDRDGRIYVFDAEQRELSRFAEDGTKTVLAREIDGFIGLQSDRSGNRIILTQRSGAVVMDVAGNELFTLSGVGVEPMYTDVSSDVEGSFRGITGTGPLSIDIGVRRWNAQGEETGLTEFSNQYLLAHNGSVDPGQFHDFTFTRTGDLYYIDNFAGDPLWGTLLKGAGASQPAFRSDSSSSEQIAFDASKQSWMLSDESGDSQSFDADGYPTEKRDLFGNSEHYEYGDRHQLAALRFSAGGAIHFEYDGAGHLSAIADLAGRRTLFRVDAASNLTEIILPDGAARMFTYDQRHRMLSKADPLGRLTQFAVNGDGAYTQIRYPDGSVTGFVAQRVRAAGVSDPDVGIPLDPSGMGVAELIPGVESDRIVDPLGAVSKWQLDGRGYLVSRTGPSGDGESTVWDGNGRPKAKFDGMQNSSAYGYDEAGRVISVERFDSAQNAVGGVAMEYAGPFHQVSKVTDPNGNVTRFSYGASGALSAVTNALGQMTTVNANPSGLVTASTDPLGRTSSYAYDSSGNLSSITDPTGSTHAFVRNLAGYVTETIDPLGHRTGISYDAMNRVVSTVDAGGGTVEFGYDEVGNRTSVTDPRGAITHYEFDLMDRPTRTIAPDGAQTTFGYDAAGRLIAVADPEGRITRYSYDASGRLTGTTDPLGRASHFDLDSNGNVVRVKDAMGRISEFAYNALSEVIASVAPDGGITGIEYDAAGNRTVLTDPLGGTTHWTFDSLNRIISETDRLGRARSSSFDAAGQLEWETNRRGQRILRTYDAAGRLVALDLGSDLATWNYDAAGRPVLCSNSSGNITLGYDSAGRIASSLQPAGLLSFEYDMAGNRIRMADAVGTTLFSYDERNRLSTLADPIAGVYDFVFDRGSRLSAIGYPNGVTAAFGFDGAGESRTVVHQRGADTIAGASYSLNGPGNRSEEMREDNISRTFGYDAKERLLAAQSSNPGRVPSELFGYDLLGNETSNGRRYNAANEMTEDSSYLYTYDEDGNLTRKQARASMLDVTEFAWDALNRLESARTAVARVDFAYDGFGRRASRTETDLATNRTQTVRFLYDGDNVRLEVSSNGTVLAANTHSGLDSLLGRTDFAAGRTEFVHADGLNSTIALTDPAGQVVERYRYSAFGETTVLAPNFATLSSPPRIPYTYTGREWDPVLNLYNYRARYYSPTQSRFLSQDPLGFTAGDPNFYAYVGNNPTNLIDPYGMESLSRSELESRIASNIETLHGIANRLPPGQRQALVRQIWDATSGATSIPGFLGDLTEGSFRLAELGLEAREAYVLENTVSYLHTRATPLLNWTSRVTQAFDVAQLAVDLNDQDELSLIQHSAGMASSAASKINPALGIAVSSFRFTWEQQSSKALDDISRMDRSSIDATVTQKALNVKVGLFNLKGWREQLKYEP